MSVSRCVSTARRSRSLQAVNHLRSGIEGLTGQQEELEETREEVLIGRETLRKLRQALREQRARTANAEIALMNGFRQHYNHGGDQIPADLVTAYASVDEERNKLGTMEDVYLEAEEDQAALEWTLTELETNLYQSGLRQLLDDSIPDDYAIATPEEEFVAPKPRASIPPSTVIQYQVATQELEQLVDRFQTLRQHISNRIISETDLGVPDADLLDLDTNEFVQSFLDLLDRISQSQVKVQHLKSELIHRGTEMTVVDRRFSEPVPRIPGENIYSDLTRTLSDGSTAHLEDGTFVAHHIRDWLLNCLRENAVQRVQYLGILHQTLSFMEAMLPDLTHWEMLARKHWALDLTDQMDASVVVVPSPSQEANNRFDMDLQEFQDADPSHLGPKTPLLYGLNSPSLSWTEAPAYTHTPGSAALEDETMDLDLEDSHLYERDLATANEETLQHSDTCQEHHENHLNGIPQVRVADCCAARCDSAHNSVRGEHHLETPLSQSQNVEEQQPVLVSDITTLSGTTIAPIVSASAAVDLTYSEWQWSPVLQREVCYAFGPEDTIIEVMWLNPVPKNDEDVPSVQLSSHSTEQTRSPVLDDQRYNDDDITTIDSIVYPWSEFCRDHCSLKTPQFRCVSPDQQDRFYVKGRVFNILLVQANEEAVLKTSPTTFATNDFDPRLCYEIRRFVVIRNKHTFSQCIPIQSERDCGTTGPGSMLDYSIMYTSEHPPKPRPREHFVKRPIRVQPCKGEWLPPECRAYFGKTYAVKHDFPVSDIGLVVGQQVYLLQLYCSASYK